MEQKNSSIFGDLFKVIIIALLILAAINLFYIITISKKNTHLENEKKVLNYEIAVSQAKIDSLRYDYQNLEKVAKIKDSSLALSLKRIENTPVKTVIVYKQALNQCLEAREIDRKRIKTLKGLDVEHEIKENNFEQLVKLNDEYAKLCRKKQRKSFGIGFGVGLLVGLLIP